MKTEAKEQARTRMRRIAGQVAGVERMIEEDRYCVDVLHQIAAVRAALDRVGKIVLASHVETCVAEAFASGSQREQRRKREELLEIFSRFGRIGGGT